MRTAELFKHKTVISYEIFPPRRTDPITSIYDTIEELKDLNPDFISVTYGAGGSKNNRDMLKIASDVKNNSAIESVAHLPCINFTRDEVVDTLAALKFAGIDNILALRGDLNPDRAPRFDFKYASDLISFIHKHGDFNIIAACYPEGHLESKNGIEDIGYLKEKVNAGVSSLITQTFFDNSYFYSFQERAAIAGIHVPIQAGIMPVVNQRQIKRLLTLSGATLPKKFQCMMDRYGNHAEAMRDAGIAYAIDQIVDLIAQGVAGIHLYTMNKPYIAYRITKAVKSLLDD